MISFFPLPANIGIEPSQLWLYVSIEKQSLMLLEGIVVKKQYQISTSKFGIGNQQGSYKTPTGWHEIAECIGHHASLGEIFKSRISTGQLYSNATEKNEDSITTRILWLRGLEHGLNVGEGIDSYDRFIYIHGTNQEQLIGTPASFGCVRMGNSDIAEMFPIVNVKMLVLISQ
ncbi:MAG: L,D-transpeptidase [Methylacidiphilales bacterium]|nr:L,D-transpeptidase [Candidatus Methylacidiphilales bacterium]